MMKRDTDPRGGRMDGKASWIEELDFCGLWRQGREEDYRFLMVVDAYRVVWADMCKVWVRGKVIQYSGLSYPKTFEIVMPRKGFVFMPDLKWDISELYDSPTIELWGDIFGPPPLQSYVMAKDRTEYRSGIRGGAGC